MDVDGRHQRPAKEWTWTVVINAKNALFDDDYVPFFTDQLPEGMELAEDTITVACYGAGHQNNQGGAIWDAHERNPAKVSVAVQDGTIQPVDLTQGYPDRDNPWPTGISGMRYTITYKTKLSADEIARVKGTEEEHTYNNVASLTDGNNVKNTAEKETTYKYNFLNKSDDSPEKLSKDVIQYSIVANPDELTLNGGSDLTVSDVLDTSVELVTNSVSVTDKNGSALSSATVGYHDDTRELSITIPDETYAKITFRVTAANLNDLDNTNDKTTYTNTANLKGQGEYSDSVSKDHRVLEHSATITGEKNAISLHKVDQYNLATDLADAKFSLYKCTLDDNYKIVGTEQLGETGSYKTDGSGTVTFKRLVPYTLYYWVEEEAPQGYEITSDLPHYFVMFEASDDAATEAANQQRAKVIDNMAQENNTFDDGSPIIVNTVKDQYTWIVTNLKVETVKQEIAGSKTLTGRDMGEDEEFEFVLEAVTEDAPMPEASETVTVDGTKATTKVTGAKDGEETAFSFGEITFKKDGTYTYKVTETPGSDTDVDYDDTVFTVEVTVNKNQETGALTAELTVNGSSDTAISFTNTYEEKTTDVSISKQDLGQGTELAGATLKLTKEGQETAPDDWTWLSDGSVHEVKGLTDGTYTLTETSAPDGYKKAESITFTIRDGKLVTEGNDAIVDGVVTMKDEQ